METTTPRDLIRALHAAGWRRMPIKHFPSGRDADGAPYYDGCGSHEHTWARGNERIKAFLDPNRHLGWLVHQPIADDEGDDDDVSGINCNTEYLASVGLSRLAVVMLVLGITGAQR